MTMSTQRIEIGSIGYDATPTGVFSSARPAAFADIASRVRNLLAEFIKARALRRAEKELMQLDDRMLKDIGLARSEISSAVRNPGSERLNGARFPQSSHF